MLYHKSTYFFKINKFIEKLFNIASLLQRLGQHMKSMLLESIVQVWERAVPELSSEQPARELMIWSMKIPIPTIKMNVVRNQESNLNVSKSEINIPFLQDHKVFLNFKYVCYFLYIAYIGRNIFNFNIITDLWKCTFQQFDPITILNHFRFTIMFL